MITYHGVPIPESDDSGSMGDGGHSPAVDPSLTTALILDPTGPGYRLDSKLVAELSAPLPKKAASFPSLPLFLVLLPFLLGTLVLYSGIEDYERDTTPFRASGDTILSGPTVSTSTQAAKFFATTFAPDGVQNEFLRLNTVQAAHPDSSTEIDKKPTHQRWRMSKFLLGLSAFCNIAVMLFVALVDTGSLGDGVLRCPPGGPKVRFLFASGLATSIHG